MNSNVYMVSKRLRIANIILKEKNKDSTDSSEHQDLNKAMVIKCSIGKRITD